jgi:prevent-host-death family protein
MTRRIGTVKARQSFSQLIGEAGFGGEHVIIERRGTPMAVLIGVDEYEELLAARARERERRFERLLSIAEHHQDATPVQVEQDVSEAVTCVREDE